VNQHERGHLLSLLSSNDKRLDPARLEPVRQRPLSRRRRRR
jgi:hypothetical protein